MQKLQRLEAQLPVKMKSWHAEVARAVVKIKSGRDEVARALVKIKSGHAEVGRPPVKGSATVPSGTEWSAILAYQRGLAFYRGPQNPFRQTP